MTKSRPLAFHRALPKTGSLPGGSFGLAPDLARKARARVKWFALAMMVMSLIGLVFVASWHAAGFIDRREWLLESAIFLVNASVSVVIWRLARGSRVGDAPVLHLGLVLEFIICMGGAFGTNWSIYTNYGFMSEMSWVTPIIILFPLIVPYPPRRMLLASLLVAITEPLSVLVLWFGFGVPRDPQHLSVIINPFLAAWLAYFAARVIWSLNVEITRARRLGSYQLEDLLGRGGMGEVWRATHQLLARPAAVKLIRPEALAADPAKAQEMLGRFEQEAQATAHLRSPHTVQLYDFGRSEDGAFYYVMELLDGIDFATLVKEHGPQEPARVVHLLVQACSSLEEAHRSGLIHRDIKPANLFACRYATQDDFVKVLDFGLVKDIGAEDGLDAQLTRAGVVLGTPGFLSAELALGKPGVDGRADIYALGCVAYWLLTGSYVFPGETPMEQMVQHAKDAPEAPSGRSEFEIPEALDRVILSCLAKDPADRPATALDLAEELKACPLDRPWTPERARQWWDLHEG